jgi:hypothetical protein
MGGWKALCCMISTKATRIWTAFGYLFADDLYIGEKVISFNPERGVCEYDQIQGVQIEHKQCMGYGVNSKSMRQILTPDHPILIWDDKLKTLDRVPIQDKFMSPLMKDKKVLLHALFEPYHRSQDMEDIKWSARIAATMASHRRVTIDIMDIVKDLGGYEAQSWLDTFFHWNKLMSGKNWMKTVNLSNMNIRDIVFHIGPRAGVGIKYYIYNTRQFISMTTDGTASPFSYSGWFKQTIDEPVFNVTTRNGNVLARSSNGTFLIACNKGE